MRSYDQWNRLVLVQHPAPGGREFTEYDDNGNVVTVIDANGNATRNTYDELNRLKMTVDAQNIAVRYGYDWVGNRTSVTDGMGHTTQFAYDGLNRNTVTTDHLGRTVTLGYDGVNKVSRTDSLNRGTTYNYNSRNRLESAMYLNQTADNLTYHYDPAGNLLSVNVADTTNLTDVTYTYDALNRVESETSAVRTHQYRYDAAGNRAKIVYEGPRTVTSTYDALNRLEKLEEGGRTTLYAYDLNGNVTGKTLGNNDVVQMDYDALNRTKMILGGGAGAQYYKYTIEYDLVGNVTKSAELYAGALGNRTVTMKYDLINRLIEERIVGGGDTTTTYRYDRANNRTSKMVSVANGGTTSSTYSYNELNQLTSASGPDAATFTYDENGNRKSRTAGSGSDNYVYDQENRLRSLSYGGITYTYKYDYRGRRVERTEGGVPTEVSFSGGTSVHEGSSTAQVDYIRGSDFGGGVGGILYSLRGGSAPSYAHYNHRGDVTTRTNSSGTVTYQAAYEAFGTHAQEDGASLDRQRANTKEEDPTGLLNEGFRYRDLATGTFITRDPAGFVDGPNLYAYVQQNPWSKFDPEGLKTIEDYQNEAVEIKKKITKLERYQRMSMTRSERADLNEELSSARDALKKNAEEIARIQEVAEFSNTWEAHLFGHKPVQAQDLDDESKEFGDIATSEHVVDLFKIGAVPQFSEGAANRAAFEAYKDALRAQMSRPAVSNQKLKSLLEELYRPNAKVGSGSTAAAVRSELATGKSVGNKFHSQKAQDSIRALKDWLKKNPDASAGDRAAAENVIRDTENALKGRP